MTELKVVQGSDKDWPLQCWNTGSNTAPVFQATDTLSAYLYQGQDQAPLLTLATTWFTDNGTQTGYDQGQVMVSPTAQQTAGLEDVGVYSLEVWWTATGGARTACIWRGTVRVESAAGTATQQVKPYCAYSDLLRYASWVTLVQQSETDQEGFYNQRLEARQWLDWLITRSWRGTSAAYFGDAARSAQFWQGGWVRRTPSPSYWLIGVLAGGRVTGVSVTNGGSGYSQPPLVTFSGGGDFGSSAAAVAILGGGSVSSIQMTHSGSGYATPPVVGLIGGGGSGATATAILGGSGALIVRPQIIRVCAYKAISLIGLNQIGINNQLAAYGAMFSDKASAEVGSIVAEVDLNGDGIADIPIPISPSNTLYT